MLISYKWLQSYFDEKLPAPEKLADLITFSFAEIESLDKLGTGDTVFDIKVLPDRACYALSHRGVAYEVAAILGKSPVDIRCPQPLWTPDVHKRQLIINKVRPLSVRIDVPDLCLRYMARVVENVTQKAQLWVRDHLEAVGQRSINPIVDGANIVMFDMGQPLHAFDADKVEGGIVVRRARKGEKITTLDNREVQLDESILVIADEKSPLAIAGIKGGKKAEVTSQTKNLILESASFDASYIRKASERSGIKTDASKRYENRFSSSLADKGLADFSAYLFEMDNHASFGEICDVYPSPVQEKSISIAPAYIERKLGITFSSEKAREILERLLVKVLDNGFEWVLTPPVWRADLILPEDISEEVGRLIGYDKIPAIMPPKGKGGVEIPKSFYYEWKIRARLADIGFSEVMTSSFAEKGNVAIEKPLAEDKKYARENLRSGFEKALKMNLLNAPLFGTDETRVFEIGRIFTKDGEKTALAIGVAGPKKKIAGSLESGIKAVSDMLGVPLAGEIKDGVFECALDNVFERLPEPKEWDVPIYSEVAHRFVPFSHYPFIVRDVALFVSGETAAKDVRETIWENTSHRFDKNAPVAEVVRLDLFDEFEKDGRKSFAFRLLFQATDRTLTDDEVNGVMEKVYSALKGKGWEVR